MTYAARAVPMLPAVLVECKYFDASEEAYAHSLKPSPQLHAPRNKLLLSGCGIKLSKIILIEVEMR
jgi:hypothetical protein